VFRDRDELPASADLGGVIKKALEASHYLIVICSRNAAQSQWVNQEIEMFLALGRRDHILAIIVDGEPNSGDARECFPPALRRFEPIAADARAQGDGKTNAKLKLLAGMLGVNFDSLRQRDVRRRRKRLALTGVAAALLIALVGTLIGVAAHQRQTAVKEKGTGDRHLYGADMLRIPDAWAQGDIIRIRTLLDGQCPDRTGGVDLRGFEWYYWWKQSHAELLTIQSPDLPVYDLHFSRDGKRIVASNKSITVREWDVTNGKEPIKRELEITKDDQREFSEGHKIPDPRLTAFFSPNGKRLAGPSGRDEDVSVWNAENGRKLLTLKRNGGDSLSGASFSPDGKRLAERGEWETVKVWDAETGKALLAAKATDGSFRFSPDGKRIALGSEKGVKIWDMDSGTVLLTLNETDDSFSFSPDGKRIASACDKGLRIQDVDGGKELLVLPVGNKLAEACGSICFSPDGMKVASGTSRAVYVWDANSGRKLQTINTSAGRLCFSPDSKRLASRVDGKMVKVWSVETGKELRTFKGHSGYVRSLCFSLDGKRIASSSEDGTVKIWDSEGDLEASKTEEDRRLNLRADLISPDGRRLAEDRFDGVTLSDAETGRLLSRIPKIRHPTKLDFSPDGKRFAALLDDGTVKIWDTESGSELLSLKGHHGRVTNFCFSPDGRRLASGSQDDTVKVWDTESGREILTLKETSDVFGFSPDGTRLASNNTVGIGTVRMWDAVNGQLLFVIDATRLSPIGKFCFSPDGKRLASDHGSVLKVWNATTGKELLTFEVANKYAFRSIFCFSPDSKSMAVVSANGNGRVYDAVTGNELLVLSGGSRGVTQLCYSLDGKRMASTDEGGSVRVWDAVTGLELLVLEEKDGRFLFFSQDGMCLNLWRMDGTLARWDAASHAPSGP
jgi:WD40 repeat protein